MENKTDKELVFEAGRARSIDSASVEMTRRLKNSIEKLNKTTERYSRVLISLTLILAGIGISQLLISSYSPDKDILSVRIIKVMGSLFFTFGIVLIYKQITNELFTLIKEKRELDWSWGLFGFCGVSGYLLEEPLYYTFFVCFIFFLIPIVKKLWKIKIKK